MLIRKTKDTIIGGCEGKKTTHLQLDFFIGLQMCCFVRGLLNGAFPDAPKRRNARGVKKIKTPCREVSKSNNPVCIFIFIHCQVSGKVSQSGVWLAPNGGSYTQAGCFRKIVYDELPFKFTNFLSTSH